MSIVTRQQLADIRGCEAHYVSMKKLPKLKDGNYSLKIKKIRDFFIESFK